MTAPLILLDVDGVLNPFNASRNWLDKSTYRRHRELGFTVWLTRDHGRALRALAEETGAELAWCTTWENDANDHIGKHVGLPVLPVVNFPKLGDERWKFPSALRFAQGRPLVWFDDDFDRQDDHRTWFLTERGNTPTLLHNVDPATGLADEDIATARAWLQEALGVTT